MNQNKKRIAVYVIHGQSLDKRLPHLLQLKQDFENSTLFDTVKFNVIDTFEPSDLIEISKKNLLQSFVDVTPSSPEHLAMMPIDELQPNGRPGPPLHPAFHALHNSTNMLYAKQASNALKHFAAIKMIHESDDDDTLYHLVLEDDVIYSNTFDKELDAVISSAPFDWEMMFLGLPITRSASSNTNTPSTRERDNGESVLSFEKLEDFYKQSKVSSLMACDSYLLRPVGAQKLASNYLPVRFPAHIHMSWRIGGYVNGISSPPYIRCYNAFPNVFLDGSKVGVFSSTLTRNNRLLWNKAYINAASIIKNTNKPLTEDQKALFERTIISMGRLNQSPDVQALVGNYLATVGRYKEAEKCMSNALLNFKNNGAILDKHSDFLNNFCDIYQFLQ